MNKQEQAEQAVVLHRALKGFFDREHKTVYELIRDANLSTMRERPESLLYLKAYIDALTTLEATLKSYIQDHEISVLKENR